jgi:hypothetical protein
MDRNKLYIIVSVALLTLVFYSAWLWRPERQVRLHTAHLLKAVEGRRWKKVDAFVADNYSDRWNHDKGFVLRASNEVFGQFLFLSIQSQTLTCEVSGSTGVTRDRVKIGGSGGPIAQLVVEQVNRLQQPFVFTWERMSWKPWDWRLTRFDQPELAIDPNLDL